MLAGPGQIPVKRQSHNNLQPAAEMCKIRWGAEVEQVTYRSDKAEGPTAGTAAVDPLEFLPA